MQRLSYPTKTILSNKNTMNRIVPSFKDSLRKALGRQPLKGESLPGVGVGAGAGASGQHPLAWKERQIC